MFANNVIATKLTLDLFSFKLLPESNPSIYAEPAKKPLRVYLRKKEKKKSKSYILCGSHDAQMPSSAVLWAQGR